MKNHFFHRTLFILLALFVANEDALSQTNCTIVVVPVVPQNRVILVNSAVVNPYLQGQAAADTHVELLIPAGNYDVAKFENLSYCKTTIKINDLPGAPEGEVIFEGYKIEDGDPRAPTIQILNCHNLEFNGHRMKVLDAYGTGIPGNGNNMQAVNIAHASSYIDIHRLDIQNPSGFCGIMAKDSPGCVNGMPIDTADANAPFIHHIYIHDNYIHNIPNGEGIYAGDTGFMKGNNVNNCGLLYPQKIENVSIYSNFIEGTGWDAIQLGSCIAGGKIYDNFCVEYGTLGEGGMSNGIQIGLGNIGTVCERNFIRQSAERAENAGHGILCQAAGNNCIQNNIIYNTQENAIYVAEQMKYEGGDNAIGHQFIDDDIREDLTGANIVHNTLMYPAKAVNPNAAPFGIRVVFFANRNPPVGGIVKNNLIFGTSENNGVAVAPGAMIICNGNKVISEGWKKVRDQYLDSYGTYVIPDNAPYAAAMESYFTTPAISEEDNYFRSPADFYPVHLDIINNAAYECTGICEASGDFFGTARSVTEDCKNDYGAVELTFPVFSISEDCAAPSPSFTIHPADQTGTFSWTFGGMNSMDSNPVFVHPGAGSHPLTFTYSSADNCSEVSGTIVIELTCSCPCEGTTAINIEAGEGTSWQDTEIMGDASFHHTSGYTLDLNNRCMSINGRLLIDNFISQGEGLPIDLNIKNGFIRMQPGAEIVVQNGGGLRIHGMNGQDGENGKGIHGCEFMWEGIDVEAGGRIIVAKSTIQDANTAIGITGSADVDIQRSRFENNYRGLDIAPFINPAANDPAPFSLTVRPNGLSGNYFGTTAAGLKGTIDGGIPVETKGNVGIKMDYLNFGFVEGDPAGDENTFENLRHGIYASQSDLVVLGSTFRQVDYGARLFHTPAILANNTFEDVALRGIESLGASMLYAEGNTMTNINGRGINCERTIPVLFLSLIDNTIASQDHGINVEATLGLNQLEIDRNTLTLRPPSDNTPIDRSAIRVFSIGKTLIKPIGEISNHAAINVNGYGQGITLENLNHYKINYNQINLNSEVGVENAVYRGVSLENTGISSLYGNSITANGTFPTLHAFHLAGAQNNKLCCNSTDGGGTGLYFFGSSSSENGLNNTSIGNHPIGLLCEAGTIIGAQNYRGNIWTGSYGDKAAVHRGTFEQIIESTFRVLESPGTPFRPLDALIETPNAQGAVWFEESVVSSSTCEANADCQSASLGVPPDGKESDQKVAEGDYATGDYALVHNWEAGLELFARLKGNETLRNSETWYQSFYSQNDGSTIGDYTKVHEQFQVLLSLSDEERQNADALWESIEEGLKKLKDIGVEFNQATTEADSLALEADWLEKYADMGKYFANWRQLSDAVRQRMAAGIPDLQATNAALTEDILPAANEKLMNAIQLQRILGEPLTEKQQADLAALAFSCPLEAGNAVYRARTWLRMQGSYVFDDNDLCGLGKEKPEEEGDGKKSLSLDTGASAPGTHVQWQIYPNPTQGQVWLEGPKGASLTKIQLFDHLGRILLTAQGGGDNRQELQLPAGLFSGVYFLVLEQADGSRQTYKLIVKP